MKGYSILALAALSSGFILPNEQVFNLRHVEKEAPRNADSILHDLEDSFGRASDEIEGVIDRFSHDVEEKYNHFAEDAEDTYRYYSSKAQNGLDEALAYTENTASEAKQEIHDTYFDGLAWAESAKNQVQDNVAEAVDYSTLGHGHHGRHGRHGHKPNQTVYQLIASSKYTTKLASLINEFDDLVEALNGTSANFTVFAPTDYAFKKIPKGAPKPSKEFLKALLSYHVSPDFYPAGRVLVSRTIPSLLKSPALGKKPLPQRLATNIGLKGLTVNFYSRVVAIDIFGTNGVIHGVDSIILPPPSILKIIDLLPTEFSTLELGLGKTGLLEALNTTDHAGGTFFAPSNFAFQKLGPRINAFLFSSYGLKYLKPLLEYHVVPEQTLYSDAFYKGTGEDDALTTAMRRCPYEEDSEQDGVHSYSIPKGVFHVDLPTLLKGRKLAIDIARYGRLIEIKINAFARVAVPDGVAYDGVIHGMSEVIIPPKKLADGTFEVYDGSQELTVEDLKERLEPFVSSSTSSFWENL